MDFFKFSGPLWSLIDFHAIIEDLCVEVVKVLVTLRADVGRLEGLLVHWQPLDPLFRVNIVDYGLLVD